MCVVTQKGCLLFDNGNNGFHLSWETMVNSLTKLQHQGMAYIVKFNFAQVQYGAFC